MKNELNSYRTSSGAKLVIEEESHDYSRERASPQKKKQKHASGYEYHIYTNQFDDKWHSTKQDSLDGNLIIWASARARTTRGGHILARSKVRIASGFGGGSRSVVSVESVTLFYILLVTKCTKFMPISRDAENATTPAQLQATRTDMDSQRGRPIPGINCREAYGGALQKF